jgi:hypothetical protein
MGKDIRVIASGACQLGRGEKPLEGPRRLGQKFIIELLTETGSMRYLPRRGCHFLARLRKAALTEYDVLVAFVAARHQIRRHLRSEEKGGLPLDECFSGATLDGIAINDDMLQLDITVRSKAGAAVRVMTPPIGL